LTRQLSLWLPLGFYIALIFFLSSRTLPQGVHFAPDYVLHALEYLVLGALMVRAINNGIRKPLTSRTMSWSLAACLGLAILDEFTQRSVPNRVASWTDLIADGIGAATGVLIVWMVHAVLSRPAGIEKG
jgi:VanZ family protein